MNNKYYNEAIIGNKKILASYTAKGELLRLYYPNRDFMQYIDKFETGVKINDSNIIYLHDDINNVYMQYYDTDTNILNTEIQNTYFNLKILQTDFAPVKENILVKKYTFINEATIDLEVNFLIHSKLHTSTNEFISTKIIDNGMMQYSHGFSLATFAKKTELLSHQIHGVEETIKTAQIQDKDYIGMSNEAAISYYIGTIKPGEKRVLEICMLPIENSQKSAISEVEDEIERIKKLDLEKEYTKTKVYWRKFVKDHNGLNLKEPKNGYEEKIQKIYKRSILLLPLLVNHETGGIIAAVEADENFTKCGRYSYCWPRDGVQIAKALDLLNMEKEAEKFYKVFCKNTQSKNGMWEQRFFTDGKLAPCWGYQVDETASVIIGVYDHYQKTKNEKFLKDCLKMCEKAAKFLKQYIVEIIGGKLENMSEDVVEKEIKEKANHKNLHVSYDLWEMNEGVHLYSLSSIHAAFEAMKSIYKALGTNASNFENNRLKQEQIIKREKEINLMQEEIKKYILENFYDEEKKSFVRNLTDKNMDISILGIVTPYKLFSPTEKKITNTIEKINMTLRTYTGGYQRFEQDHYMRTETHG